jgi:hypothetical protein
MSLQVGYHHIPNVYCYVDDCRSLNNPYLFSIKINGMECMGHIIYNFSFGDSPIVEFLILKTIFANSTSPILIIFMIDVLGQSQMLKQRDNIK